MTFFVLGPYFSRILKASAPSIPISCRETNISPHSLWLCQLALIRSNDLPEIPGISLSLSISLSMMLRVSIPNLETILVAKPGPMPFINPLERRLNTDCSVLKISFAVFAMNVRP